MFLQQEAGAAHAPGATNERSSGGVCAGANGGNGVKRGVSLGTNAKYDYRAQKSEQNTGEIAVYDPMVARVQRFILQSVARSLLPKSRLDKCIRLRQKGQDISIWHSEIHQTAHYGGLQTCGSVWVCPVCAAKIAERRRQELLTAIDAHRQEGVVNLLTLTCPHQSSDILSVLLDKQAKALKRFWSDKTVKSIFAAMGTIGQVRALEVTHGRLSPQNNGWHPHYHILMFQGIDVNQSLFNIAQMKDWQVRLYLCWANACTLAGLGEPSLEHGLKLDNGEHAAKYATKWGLEDEMTKGHTKKAIHGETPFDFLRAYLSDKNDKQAAALFSEFAMTFKGKRQLHWSKGLKARYLVADKTDEVLAAETDEAVRLLGLITLAQWRDVLCQKVDCRGLILKLAVKGWDSVTAFLDSIKGQSCKNVMAESSEFLASLKNS